MFADFDNDDYSHEYGLTNITYGGGNDNNNNNNNNNNKDIPDIQPNLIAETNPYMIQAEADRFGILRRYDDFTGENKNNVSFTTEPEKKINLNQNEVKFLPCERLLMTIQEEKPELLQKMTYKKISTKRKNKLKIIKDKLFNNPLTDY